MYPCLTWVNQTTVNIYSLKNSKNQGVIKHFHDFSLCSIVMLTTFMTIFMIWHVCKLIKNVFIAIQSKIILNLLMSESSSKKAP